MAHPLRIRLLAFLNREGTATATQCAREVGESVASCSYHLNILAKYDCIEQAEGGQGREKPWRVVHEGHSWSEVGTNPEATMVAGVASQAFLEFVFDQTRQRIRMADLEPDEWREAVGADESDVFLTAAEAVAIREQVRAIIQRYKDRRDNKDLRPEGARPVSFFLALTVAPRINPA